MNQEKKKRTRRSAEKMAELVLEAERVGASQVLDARLFHSKKMLLFDLRAEQNLTA